MNKRLATAVAVASIFAASAAHAATSTQTFNVTVALTSSCTAGTIADVAFTYTSFQAGASTASGGGFNVTCTTSLPYTLSLDATSGTVIGLNYTLGGLPATTQTGTGAAQAYTITGSMAGGQSGTCATAGGACSGSQGRTLTITY